MKHNSYHSRVNKLYPSEMGSDNFGLYRNLAKENDIEYSIKNEKFENLSKNPSRRSGIFGKRK